MVEDCTEVLEAEPDNSKALFRRAMSLVNLEQWDQAVRRQHAPRLPTRHRRLTLGAACVTAVGCASGGGEGAGSARAAGQDRAGIARAGH